ncbi:MAG: DEAD/DEAH box helicase [Bacilli bacterium]|nr:DEAD/DEAH box helicase [Bacilli bacterium]
MKELIIVQIANNFYLDFENDVSLSETRIKQEEQLYKDFKTNKYKSLLEIVLTRNKTIFSDSLLFYINIAKFYINQLSKTINSAKTDQTNIVLAKEEIENILSSKYLVLGNEYLTQEFINNVINEFNLEINSLLKKYKSIDNLFKHYNYHHTELGRIIFNLIISKDDNYPFAFMATYQSEEKRILPLKQAMIEYRDDNKALLNLLSTISKASKKSDFIKDMVDNKSVYLPLKLTAEDAFTFLKEIEIYEECGILCRIPDFWKKNNRKVKASINVGGVEGINIIDLLNINSFINIGEVKLTLKEVKALLEKTEGLAFIKGKWVEVNHDKLNQVIKALEEAKDKINVDDLTIIDALRLELNPDKLITAEHKGLIEITNGEYLDNVLNDLIFPEKIKEQTIPAKNFKANLRLYQQNGLNWLEYMKQLKLGSCLADDMGLGKTIQILAFLSNRLEEKTLLIVPASLITNWIKEFNKFLPNINVNILHPFFEKDNTKDNEIYITTYNLISKYDFILKETFDNVIIDEAQNIKNSNTKQSVNVRKIKSKYKIALTGTPIENRLSDLFSIFDFLNPGLLGTPSEFKKLISNLKENEDMGKLKNIISPFILRRLKTDKKIINDLPDKLEMKKYIALTEKQRVLYESLVNDLTTMVLNPEVKNMNRIILPSFIKFKQICNHPAQFLDNEDYNLKDSGKFMMLSEICNTIKSKGEKVLIFTQFKEIIPYIDKNLKEIFGKGLKIDGSTSVKKRGEYVDSFNNDIEIKYMILSLKAGGVGLNLTSANHVIHFDRWWNPAVENQATDRAYRIGQNKKVNVYKFITGGTIEEKIDEMLENKTKMTNEVITAGEEWIGNMSKSAIIDLFRLER